MNIKTIDLAGGKTADGYVIPLGTVNLVFVKTEKGMIACGAFNVAVLDKFDYPAVRIASKDGSRISGPEDLLKGVAVEVNESAASLGIETNCTGEAALELL